MDEKREMLRHTLATLVYRAAKPLRDAAPDFASFKCSQTSRTPLQILAHIGDLYDWALTQARGAEAWTESTPLDWEAEVARFFTVLPSGTLMKNQPGPALSPPSAPIDA